MVPEGSALAVKAQVLGDILLSRCGVAEFPSAGIAKLGQLHRVPAGSKGALKPPRAAVTGCDLGQLTGLAAHYSVPTVFLFTFACLRPE